MLEKNIFHFILIAFIGISLFLSYWAEKKMNEAIIDNGLDKGTESVYSNNKLDYKKIDLLVKTDKEKYRNLEKIRGYNKAIYYLLLLSVIANIIFFAYRIFIQK